MNVAENLRRAASLNETRHAEYGENVEIMAATMEALFPDGVELNCAKDHARFALIISIVTKLSRYTSSWNKPVNPDHMRDLTVYGAMLEATDANGNRAEHG